MPAVSPNGRWFNPLIIDDSSSTGILSPQPGSQETQSWLLQVNPEITQHRRKVGSEGLFIGSPHEHWLSEAWLHRPYMVPISSVFSSPHSPDCAVQPANQFVVRAAINNTLSFNPEYLIQHDTVRLVRLESSSTTYSAVWVLKLVFPHLLNGNSTHTYFIWLRWIRNFLALCLKTVSIQ